MVRHPVHCSWVKPWQPSWVPYRYKVGKVTSLPQAAACSAAHSGEPNRVGVKLSPVVAQRGVEALGLTDPLLDLG